MQSFFWYILRFSGKIAFLLSASKFLSPEVFVRLQTFTITGEAIILASSSATAIYMSKEIAQGRRENFYWTINVIEISMAGFFIIMLYSLTSIASFMTDLSLLIIPFTITSLYLNLHYRYIIITKSSLIESQKFLILYEVIPYIASAIIMAWTNSFETGILTLVIMTGCSVIIWKHPKYVVTKSSVRHFCKFLKGMYLYTLLTFGVKTIERIVLIEKFYLDADLAAFLFYSKFWILGTTTLIGFRGAKIVSSLTRLSDWTFLKVEFWYIILICGILIICIVILSMNLDVINFFQFKALSNGIDSATFIGTGVYCVCLALYSINLLIAEILCKRSFMYLQTLCVIFCLAIIFYFTSSLLVYLACVSFLLFFVSSIIVINIMRNYD